MTTTVPSQHPTGVGRLAYLRVHGYASTSSLAEVLDALEAAVLDQLTAAARTVTAPARP